MRDLEQECMLLGIPVKHVIMRLPNQFELLLFLKKQILAVDHNFIDGCNAEGC
jgi:glutamine synthetase